MFVYSNFVIIKIKKFKSFRLPVASFLSLEEWNVAGFKRFWLFRMMNYKFLKAAIIKSFCECSQKTLAIIKSFIKSCRERKHV